MKSKKCNPDQAALKSFFLGPQSENSSWLIAEVVKMFERWFDWRRDLFPQDGKAISRRDQQLQSFIEVQNNTSELLREVSSRFESETPKFSPRYIGHMVSEMSMPGVLGHIQALLHNSNHASAEVSRVSKALEEEAIGDLANMLGFDSSKAKGHFTSGGTVANFEAVYRSIFKVDRSIAVQCVIASRRSSKPSLKNLYHLSWTDIKNEIKDWEIGIEELKEWSFLDSTPIELFKKVYKKWGLEIESPRLLVPMNKHYSWLKAGQVFGIGNESVVQVELDSEARLCSKSLKATIDNCLAKNIPIAMIVSVAGTTELGRLDPVEEISSLIEGYRKEGHCFWHHIDAAYGAYFSTLKYSTGGLLTDEAKKSLVAIAKSDSVTLDPHKLGYVPYACGAFIAKNIEHYQCPQSPAPYLQGPGMVDTQWAYTLEGSRPSTGAVATWLSGKSLGLDEHGYGAVLEKSMEASELLANALESRFGDKVVLLARDSNVVCFFFNFYGEHLRNNKINKKVYEEIFLGNEFGVSQTSLQNKTYQKMIEKISINEAIDKNDDHVFLIRCVTMNPFLTSNEPRIDYVESFVDLLEKKIKKNLNSTQDMNLEI